MLISVIIPSFRPELFLEDAVKSVLSQSYKKIEIIIIDDTGKNVIKNLAKKSKYLSNKKIKIYANSKNQGVSYSLNKGISKAKGKYVCWLSDDDLYHSDKLKFQIDIVKKLNFNDKILVATNFYLLKKNEKIQKKFTRPFKGNHLERILLFDDLHGCTLLMPRLLFKYNKFNAKLKHAQDYDLWLKLSSNGYKFLLLNKHLLYSRIHSTQDSILHKSFAYNEKKELYEKYIYNFFFKSFYNRNYFKIFMIFLTYSHRNYQETIKNIKDLKNFFDKKKQYKIDLVISLAIFCSFFTRNSKKLINFIL